MEHPLDIRIPLGKWLTSPENEFFARSLVNRYMGYLLGRGLVEPIDDMRDTNPPSNVALLDALARRAQTTGALVARFPDLCRTAVMKHLGVLEAVGLVLVRREGRSESC